MNGPRTMIPHKPRITLGIAASISTSAPIDVPDHAWGELRQVESDPDRQRRGEQQRDEGRDRRAEMKSARRTVVTGSQTAWTMKPRPNSENARLLPSKTFQAIADEKRDDADPGQRR